MRWRLTVVLLFAGLTLALLVSIHRLLRDDARAVGEAGAEPPVRKPAAREEPWKGARPQGTLAEGETAQTLTAPPLLLDVPDLNLLSVRWRALGEGEPSAQALLDDGLDRMQHRDFAGARHALQALIDRYPETKLAAPAFWLIGLAFYLEGGEGNLHSARGQFFHYSMNWSAQREFADLHEAAQNNIAAIDVQLMRGARSEAEAVAYAEHALKSLEGFVAQWPESIHAPAARLLVSEIQAWLARLR